MLWYTQVSRLKELKSSSKEDVCFPGGAVTPIWEAGFAYAAVPGRPATASSRAGLRCRHGHKPAPVQGPGSRAPSARGNTALSPPQSCILSQQAERDSAGAGEHPAAPPPPAEQEARWGPLTACRCHRWCGREGAKCAPVPAGAAALPGTACPQPLSVRPPAGLGPSGAGALSAAAASSKIYM